MTHERKTINKSITILNKTLLDVWDNEEDEAWSKELREEQ